MFEVRKKNFRAVMRLALGMIMFACWGTVFSQAAPAATVVSAGPTPVSTVQPTAKKKTHKKKQLVNPSSVLTPTASPVPTITGTQIPSDKAGKNKKASIHGSPTPSDSPVTVNTAAKALLDKADQAYAQKNYADALEGYQQY